MSTFERNRRWALFLAAFCCLAGGFVCGVEVAAADKPNIIYILSDDMGFSDIGCYGSEIETPHLDSLAAGGIRFTQFYNTARCCPTRASLLTGLYPHQAGVGHMMSDRGFDGYRGELNRQSVTIPEVLKSAGYRSYMAGKWHVTTRIDPKSEADKENWPRQRGFDRFYGTIHGAGSFFDPNTLTRDNTYVSPWADPEYPLEDQIDGEFYYTDAISDHATRFVKDHHNDSADQPFFMYVAYTAAHWPMHARQRDLEKYLGKYDDGYDAIRNRRYQRMLELGLINAESTVNWPIPADWKETEHWDWDKRNMEVYAAMVHRMDLGIGQIVEALKETGEYENTLICFLQDNGGCAEGYGRGGVGGPRASEPTMSIQADTFLQPDMTPKQTRDGYEMRVGKGSMSGPADTAIGYGRGWATVSNTPFREYKHWTHEGGISTPLIVHWPAGVKRAGELDHTPGHLIDLMATAVDVSSATYPATFHRGQSIKPMEGKSLLPIFSGQEFQREAIYWEHESNRAVRRGDYKLVAKGQRGDWELYNIAADRSEQDDLAESQPKLAAELKALWDAYAERANVLPLNPNAKTKPQGNRSKLRFNLGSDASLQDGAAPFIQNRGFQVTATVAAIGDGVIVAQGGTADGWSLYVKDSEPKFAATIGGKRVFVSTDHRLAGPATIQVVLAKNGDVRINVDQQEIVSAKLPSCLKNQPIDGLQVGRDENGNVGDYQAPFAFQGEVKNVVLKIDAPRTSKKK